MIDAPSFPGWNSLAENLAAHFVSAEIRHFGAGELAAATGAPSSAA